MFELVFNGRTYLFSPLSHLTLGPHRQIKQWFPDLGTYRGFMAAFTAGDPDAIACALWLVRRAEGEMNVPEPNRMPADTNIGAMFVEMNADASSRARATALRTAGMPEFAADDPVVRVPWPWLAGVLKLDESTGGPLPEPEPDPTPGESPISPTFSAETSTTSGSGESEISAPSAI